MLQLAVFLLRTGRHMFVFFARITRFLTLDTGLSSGKLRVYQIKYPRPASLNPFLRFKLSVPSHYLLRALPSDDDSIVQSASHQIHVLDDH